MSITDASKKVNPEDSDGSEFQQILCIYYPTQLSEFLIKVLMDSSSKANAMHLSFIMKLGVCIYETDMGA